MRTLDGQNVPNIDAPTTEFPYGRARNSNPPAARNGTPLQEDNLMTDMGYAMLSIMKAAGLVASRHPRPILAKSVRSPTAERPSLIRR